MSNDNNKKVKHGQTRKISRRYARLGVCGLSNTCMWSVTRRELQQLFLETTKAGGGECALRRGCEGGGGALGVSLEIWRRIILLVHLMFQLYFLENT